MPERCPECREAAATARAARTNQQPAVLGLTPVMRLRAALLVATLLVLGAVPVAAALLPLLDAPLAAFTELVSARVLGLAGRTALLGLAVAVGALLLGAPAGWTLARRPGALAGSVAVLLPLPFLLPPWMAGMAWARHVQLSRSFGAAALLIASLWPVVALFALRGFRQAAAAGDAAALARGRRAALFAVELPLAAPSLLTGALLAFVFAITDFGVVDFLSFNVAEPFTVLSSEVFLKAGRLESAPEAAAAALPVLLLSGVALVGVLLLERRHAGRMRGPSPPPARPSRGAAGALLLIALALLALAPVAELLTWAAGHAGWRNTLGEVGDDVLRSVTCAVGTGLLVALLGVAVARLSLRLPPTGEATLLALALLPLAAPGVLFALGEIRFWNHPANPLAEWLYTSPALLVLAGTARFLPLGVLAARALLVRLDEGPSEAARLSGRGAFLRWRWVELPRLLPAAGLAALLGYVLSLRELDTNHMLPAGNATLIRYLYGVVHTGSDDKTAFLAVLLVALVLVPAAAARLLGVPGVDCGREASDP